MDYLKNPLYLSGNSPNSINIREAIFIHPEK